MLIPESRGNSASIPKGCRIIVSMPRQLSWSASQSIAIPESLDISESAEAFEFRVSVEAKLYEDP